MNSEQTEKTYRVRYSKKCFNFRPQGFANHAPFEPGIYELVTFDENQTAQVLYVGFAPDTSIHDCLEQHFEGTRPPAADGIKQKFPNLYFDFLVETDAKNTDDLTNIYWWLVNKHKPVYNDLGALPPAADLERHRVIDLDNEST